MNHYIKKSWWKNHLKLTKCFNYIKMDIVEISRVNYFFPYAFEKIRQPYHKSCKFFIFKVVFAATGSKYCIIKWASWLLYPVIFHSLTCTHRAIFKAWPCGSFAFLMVWQNKLFSSALIQNREVGIASLPSSSSLISSSDTQDFSYLEGLPNLKGQLHDLLNFRVWLTTTQQHYLTHFSICIASKLWRFKNNSSNKVTYKVWTILSKD